MPTEVNILEFSNYVVHFLTAKKVEIPAWKMQKVLYYMQGWHMVAFHGHPLFNEAPEAWVSGPAYRSIYNKYRRYWSSDKSLPVKIPKGMDILDAIKEVLQSLNMEEDQVEFVDGVLTKYGFMEAGLLALYVHSEIPWLEAREGLGIVERCEKPISLETMHSSFISKLNKNGKAYQQLTKGNI
ncbi:MAG: DUF4065 domain-containing protein [Chitinophaga sp.]|uniref:Panacea domain-containing protein n=1 Tax=Chitinophaga sp. TaxID=1869181 RepID=UPI0025C3B846|nr:type II toxin-antitoxin system antitoxin SocA domain-containing protein [Chitinophaga sp.]MBV8252601.1 DUF4065 domain-containing protein [Chitinophaga sp.]